MPKFANQQPSSTQSNFRTNRKLINSMQNADLMFEQHSDLMNSITSQQQLMAKKTNSQSYTKQQLSTKHQHHPSAQVIEKMKSKISQLQQITTPTSTSSF